MRLLWKCVPEALACDTQCVRIYCLNVFVHVNLSDIALKQDSIAQN